MTYLPIRSYDNYIAANLELALLRDSGFDCYIKDEYTVTIDPLLSPALGGMKLMVEAGGADRALEVLKASDAYYLQTVPCPFCKHPSLELVTQTTDHRSWKDKMKSMLLYGQEQMTKMFYRCSNCSHEFDTLPPSV